MKAHSKSFFEISHPLTIYGHADAIQSAMRARPFAIELSLQRSEVVVVVDLEKTA